MEIRSGIAKKIETLLGVGCVATLAAGTAGAHPGHGLGGGSWNPLHFLSEPEHLVGVFALAVCALGANRLLQAQARRAGAGEG